MLYWLTSACLVDGEHHQMGDNDDDDIGMKETGDDVTIVSKRKGKGKEAKGRKGKTGRKTFKTWHK